MNLSSAIKAIDRQGILLVFPINNRSAPPSLWSHFFPKSKMLWEWDETGDDRVSSLWHLRARLSCSSRVVYAKWYQGRATFFSREVFTWLLAALGAGRSTRRLSPDARGLLEQLELDSPLSTRALKRQSGLVGRANERAYERAMKELWSRLLIVGYGEVDEGAFPSLAIGATRLMFEEPWRKAETLDADEALRLLEAKLGRDSLFFRHLEKLRAGKARRPQNSLVRMPSF